MDYKIFSYIAGLAVAYLLISFRYNKEIKIRYKWIQKRLKKGVWKFPLALFFILNISMMLSQLIFGLVSNDNLVKPFLYSFFYLMFFMIFLFKYFYEILGGKRKWRL